MLWRTRTEHRERRPCCLVLLFRCWLVEAHEFVDFIILSAVIRHPGNVTDSLTARRLVRNTADNDNNAHSMFQPRASTQVRST